MEYEQELSKTSYSEGYLPKDIRRMPIMQQFQIRTQLGDMQASDIPLNNRLMVDRDLPVIARWDPKSEYLSQFQSSDHPNYSNHLGLNLDPEYIHYARLRRQWDTLKYYSHVPKYKTDGLVHYQLQADVKGELNTADGGDDFMLKQSEAALKDFNSHPHAARDWLN